MLGRISAFFLLALALVKTLLTRLSRRDGLRRFGEHYGSEGIFAVDRDEAKILARAHRCTHCGLCDAREGERIADSEKGYRGMMAFVSAGTRSLPDYPAMARTVSGVPQRAFEEAQAQCPEHVPLLQLRQLVVSQARRREAQTP